MPRCGFDLPAAISPAAPSITVGEPFVIFPTDLLATGIRGCLLPAATGRFLTPEPMCAPAQCVMAVRKTGLRAAGAVAESERIWRLLPQPDPSGLSCLEPVGLLPVFLQRLRAESVCRHEFDHLGEDLLRGRQIGEPCRILVAEWLQAVVLAADLGFELGDLKPERLVVRDTKKFARIVD